MNERPRGRPHRIVLVIHPRRKVAADLGAIVEKWWSDRGVFVETDATENGPRRSVFDEPTDFAISLGGDGTMLRTIATAASAKIPVLGVNLGNLGYLTSVEPDEVIPALELLYEGRYQVEDRMTLEVRAEIGGVLLDPVIAINEVVLEKTSDGHTIHFAVEIGHDQFLTYAADGMVIATPTGSTAYNFSLRGPVVSPRMRALVVTPIAPHMLFDRTIVVEPERSIGLDLLEDREAIAVVDGERIAELHPGDRIEVSASEHEAKFIKVTEGGGFYRILHSKFGLLDR